jgi:hypothetical protein
MTLHASPDYSHWLVIPLSFMLDNSWAMGFQSVQDRQFPTFSVRYR